MIKVSDYIATFLADRGVRHVFMITGGGAMHLNDSLGKESRLQYVCNHHEQACAIAAEGYARTSGTIGVVCVTTGPGGTNTTTGVLGQWLDSIPTLYLSGQVRTETTVAHTGLPLRQLGDQEADIVAIMRPITKYAISVADPRQVRFHLEKAMYLATSGRLGPVWLDFPLDIQSAMIDEDTQQIYDPAEDRLEFDHIRIGEVASEILSRVQSAKRPVILAGAGIRLAGACDIFRTLIDQLQVPVLAAWDAIDIIPSDHPLYAGRPSTLGQRAANFVFQNADLLLSIGCRLNLRQIGYTFKSVARAAYKIIVDIDSAELRKPTIYPDLPVHCDAKLLLEAMRQRLGAKKLAPPQEWAAWCRERQNRYPVLLPEFWTNTERVNPYVFCDVLSDCLAADDVVVSGNGAACIMPIQALRMQKDQRHIVNSGCAAMGYGLSAAIGACFARGKRRIVCLDGDGSFQMNIQELQTVVHHQLPLKIFIFDNDGYLSIRATQKNFFEGRMVGESLRSGVSFPDLVRVADAYGIKALRVGCHAELANTIRAAMDFPGPVLCNVHMCPVQGPVPRVASQRLPSGKMVSSPLEDMSPLLEREEFLSNMLIPAWES